MREGLHLLSGREEEVLRLLLVGHDAKSIAQVLGLSVHTVNERLRYARRKLGVSSSREAARLLAEAEHQDPNFSGDKKMGVAAPPLMPQSTQHNRRWGVRLPVIWIAGGLIFMSLIIAALALSTALTSNDESQLRSPPVPANAPQEMDLMAIADTDQDGKVTAAEYRVFSEQGWGYVAQDQDKVKFAELGPMRQVAFVGITPNAEGMITHQMYIDAIPARFAMFDQDGDGTLNSDELNGRTFQPSP